MRSPKLVLCVGSIVVGAVAGVWFAQTHHSKNSDGVAVTERPDRVQPNAELPTLGSAWDWDALGRGNAAGSQGTTPTETVDLASAPFDIEVVHQYLEQIRLDEDGGLRLDDTTRRALEQALTNDNLRLHGAEFHKLKSIIEAALPGRVGQETAEIVEDYYAYLQTEEQYRRKYPYTADTDPLQDYEALVSLRGVALGWDVADQLFFKADNDARYMIESFKLAQSDQLSDEERHARQAELADRYYQSRPPIEGWDDRLAIIERERSALVQNDGELSPYQRETLTRIVQAQFTPDERAILSDYDISLVDDDLEELRSLRKVTEINSLDKVGEERVNGSIEQR